MQAVFDLRTAIEAILYLTERSQDPTFHHLSKLLYFADRLHLARYGRFICGDDYIAMRHGPVPSHIYDMLKAARDGREYTYIHLPDVQESFTVEGGYRVHPLRSSNIEWLSDSELECLDQSICEYDKYSFPELTKLSHDDAWLSADENDAISVEAIVQSIGNPNHLLEHLQDPHP